jgi:hypothetical protein
MIADAVEHQDSVYPATAQAIPLLVAALQRPHVDEQGVLALLCRVGEAAAQYVDEIAELDADDESRIAIEGTLSALAAAWPAFRQRLRDTSNRPQLQRLLRLAKFGPSGQVLDDVKALGQRPDADLRACIANLSVELDAPEQQLARWLDDEDALVRTVTAIALVLNKGDGLPARLLPLVEVALSEAVRSIPTLRHRYPNARPSDAALPGMLAVAASRVRSQTLQDLAPSLCPYLATTDAFNAADVFARGLLQLVLGTDPTQAFSRHAPEVLTAVVDSEPVWTFNVNAAEAMRGFCLPTTREELRALSAEMNAAAEPLVVLKAHIESSLE